MEFKTWFENEHYYMNPGEREENVYKLEYDKNGKSELIIDKKEKKYTFEMIQSFKDSCDVESILKRYTMGDASGLQRTEGFYTDTTAFPKDYAEFFNQIQELKNDFYNLSPDERAKYNHSLEQFVVGSKIKEAPTTEVVNNIESEVNTDES